MKYMGSKAKVARYIVPIIQKQIERSGYETYLEPFCGGCNVIDKIEAPQRIASDCNKYLIALMQHIQAGGELPATSSARNTPKSEPTATTTRNGTQLCRFCGFV
jgi:DNA adenine methylase